MTELYRVADADRCEGIRIVTQKTVVVPAAASDSVANTVKRAARNKDKRLGQAIDYRRRGRRLEKTEGVTFQPGRKEYDLTKRHLPVFYAGQCHPLPRLRGDTEHCLKINFIIHGHITCDDAGVVPIGKMGNLGSDMGVRHNSFFRRQCGKAPLNVPPDFSFIAHPFIP